MDNQLIEFLSNLDALDKYVDSKSQEYLDPNKILSLLEIDYRNLDNLTKQTSIQNSNSLFYNVISARLASIERLFEETVVNPYMAHCRHYANLYLKSLDRKETVSALQDAVIILFSNKILPDEKFSNCLLCYNMSLKIKDIEKYKEENLEQYTNGAKEFYKIMYSVPSYEDIVTKHIKCKNRREQAEALSQSFKESGIAISNIIKLRLSGVSNGPTTITIDNLNKIRRLQMARPDLDDTAFSKEINGGI